MLNDLSGTEKWGELEGIYSLVCWDARVYEIKGC